MGIMANVLLKGIGKLGKDAFGTAKDVTVGNVKKATSAVKGYVNEVKAEAAAEGFEAEINNRSIEKLADAKADLRVKQIMAAEKAGKTE